MIFLSSQSTVPVSRHSGETDVEMAYEAGEPRDSNINVDIGNYSPRNVTEEFPEVQVPRQSNLTEELNPSTERRDANSPGSVPEIEIRRDAAHELSPPSHLPFAAEQQSARVERTESLDETLNEKDPTIPSIDEEVLNSGRHSAFELRSGSPGFAGSEEERGDFGE